MMKPEIVVMTKSWRYSAGWFAQMIARSIAERGVNIAYIAPRAEPSYREPIHPNLFRLQSPRELVGSYPRSSRLMASLKRITYGATRVLRLRRHTESFIFTIPEPLPITLLLFGLLRILGARIIFVVHDPVPHAWSLPKRFRFIERAAHAYSYKLSSTLVTLTPTAREALFSSFGVSRDKVVVIPHGAIPLADVAPLSFSRKLLIFGALRRNKGVLEVVEGIVQARRDGVDVQLILAGEPLAKEPGYWDSCKAAMKADPAGFDVRVGFIQDEALPALVNEVDAFVLAYRDFNSQSGVGVLAALAERPVIGTRAGGLDELFNLGMTGIALDTNFTALDFSEAVKDLYDRGQAYWQKVGADGARQVAESLRWDTIADDYIAVARGGKPVASS